MRWFDVISPLQVSQYLLKVVYMFATEPCWDQPFMTWNLKVFEGEAQIQEPQRWTGWCCGFRACWDNCLGSFDGRWSARSFRSSSGCCCSSGWWPKWNQAENRSQRNLSQGLQGLQNRAAWHSFLGRASNHWRMDESTTTLTTSVKNERNICKNPIRKMISILGPARNLRGRPPKNWNAKSTGQTWTIFGALRSVFFLLRQCLKPPWVDDYRGLYTQYSGHDHKSKGSEFYCSHLVQWKDAGFFEHC